MSSFIVEGGHRLSGSITPQGAKNEALEVISAALLTSGTVTISNIPEILDVRNLISLLEGMGVKVERKALDPLYKKVTKFTSKYYVHDEKNESKVGDLVEIMETRPLSKLKRWRLVSIKKHAATD